MSFIFVKVKPTGHYASSHVYTPPEWSGIQHACPLITLIDCSEISPRPIPCPKGYLVLSSKDIKCTQNDMRPEHAAPYLNLIRILNEIHAECVRILIKNDPAEFKRGHNKYYKALCKGFEQGTLLDAGKKPNGVDYAKIEQAPYKIRCAMVRTAIHHVAAWYNLCDLHGAQHSFAKPDAIEVDYIPLNPSWWDKEYDKRKGRRQEEDLTPKDGNYKSILSSECIQGVTHKGKGAILLYVGNNSFLLQQQIDPEWRGIVLPASLAKAWGISAKED